jgi:hypothetical protein
MQGPSELGASGKLVHWDRTADLRTIEVPTLVIGAQHDTMDPAQMDGMAHAFPSGTYLHCPAGSHMAMYDDQQTSMNRLVEFLTSDKGRPPKQEDAGLPSVERAEQSQNVATSSSSIRSSPPTPTVRWTIGKQVSNMYALPGGGACVWIVAACWSSRG